MGMDIIKIFGKKLCFLIVLEMLIFFTEIQIQTLEIDDYPIMQNHLNTDRYAIWDRLFPIDVNKKPVIEEDEIY